MRLPIYSGDQTVFKWNGYLHSRRTRTMRPTITTGHKYKYGLIVASNVRTGWKTRFSAIVALPKSICDEFEILIIAWN